MSAEPVKINYSRTERGWAVPREDGLFVVDNLPFERGGVQFRDVVAINNHRRAHRVLERTYHSWCIVLYQPRTQESYTALRKVVEAAGAHIEGMVSGAAVFAGNTTTPAEVEELLAPLGTARIEVRVVDHCILPPAPLDLDPQDAP